MAKSWHKKHISTKWGIVILGFLLISVVLLIPLLGQSQDVRSRAALSKDAGGGGSVKTNQRPGTAPRETLSKQCGDPDTVCLFSDEDFKGTKYPIDLRKLKNNTCYNLESWFNDQTESAINYSKTLAVFLYEHISCNEYEKGSQALINTVGYVPNRLRNFKNWRMARKATSFRYREQYDR